MFIFFRITCSVSVLCCILNSDGKRFVIPAEQYQDTNLRVINDREYAFVIVLISYYYELLRLCTGAMLTEVWGLTAAHCTIFEIPYHAWFSNFTVPPIRLDTAAEVLQTYAPHSASLLYKVLLITISVYFIRQEWMWKVFPDCRQLPARQWQVCLSSMWEADGRRWFKTKHQ